MTTNKEKLNSLVKKDAKETRAWIKAQNKNRKTRRASQKIALHIRKRLEELKWRQKDLAERMEVKPQQVNKWVSGKENFRLDTIMRLGEILEVDLISIKPFRNEIKTTTVVEDVADYEDTSKVIQVEFTTKATEEQEYSKQEVIGY